MKVRKPSSIITRAFRPAVAGALVAGGLCREQPPWQRHRLRWVMVPAAVSSAG